MRRIRYKVLGFASFVMAFLLSLFTPGTWVNRALATTMCGVIGSCSPGAVANFLQGSDRAFAADVPVVVADRSSEFDDEVSPRIEPRNVKPQNIPSGTSRSDFDDVTIEKSAERRSENTENTTRSAKNVKFGDINIDKRTPELFEISQSSLEGCQYKMLIHIKGEKIYQESLNFISPDEDKCGMQAFSANFSPKGDRVELRLEKSSGMLIVEKISNNFAKATYKESSRSLDLGEFEIQDPDMQAFEPRNNDKYNCNIPINEKKREAICVAGRRTMAGLGVMLGVGALLGLGLALAMPVTAAIAGGTALTLGAYALTGSIIGWTGYLMFGGKPPNLPNFGSFLKDGSDASNANNVIDNVKSIHEGLTSESELAYKQGKASGVREAGSGTWDKVASKFRDRLTDATGVPFNLCDKKDKENTQPNKKKSLKKRSGPKKQGKSYGDPHIITFDGYRYSFQTIGEFTLVKSNDEDFEIQVRQSAVPGTGRQVTLNSGAAMKVGNHRVAFYSKDFPDADTSTPVRIDGKPVNINGDFPLDGGSINGSNGSYTVNWDSGEQVGISSLSMGGMQFMNIAPSIPEEASRYSGILGNSDGNPNNDLRTRSGKVIPTKDGGSTYGILKNAISSFVSIPLPISKLETVFFDQLYKDFGDSWRISQNESLFDYAPGQSTETFTKRGFPNTYMTLASFIAPQLKQAEAICQQANVGADMMDGCIFDVANTGEAGFAQAAANMVVGKVKQRAEQEIRKRIPLPFSLPF